MWHKKNNILFIVLLLYLNMKIKFLPSSFGVYLSKTQACNWIRRIFKRKPKSRIILVKEWSYESKPCTPVFFPDAETAEREIELRYERRKKEMIEKSLILPD